MDRSRFLNTLVICMLGSLTFAGCAPASTAAPSQPPPTITKAETAIPTSAVTLTTTPTVTPTAAPVPLPVFSLNPGDRYFSQDGKVSFIFSRNLAGYQPDQYSALLDWTQAGGSKFVRLSLDSFGMGNTKEGGIDPSWALKWEIVFTKAEERGIFVLPVFSSWYDWNGGAGYSTWSANPWNQAKGGPVKDPGELFQKGSATQTLWLQWMQSLVQRWQGRKNILAWEIFSEVNLASGTTEQSGVDFVDSAASMIRAADPSTRPVTASIADTGLWPNFYRLASIDFINLHPYPPSAQLDRTIISEVRNSFARYNKPVLIGESGLSAATPDTPDGKMTIAPNAPIGIRHATWAAVVSGAMNGRSLWWEDGVGIYFPALGMPWMQTYQVEELPAANFVAGVDFSGFRPVTTATSPGVWGATVGNAKTIIGWFRDASCEPPDWNLEPVISGKRVIITPPGSADDWQVDFYSTRDGKTVLGSASITRKGLALTVPLPDFTDDIAFKLTAK